MTTFYHSYFALIRTDPRSRCTICCTYGSMQTDVRISKGRQREDMKHPAMGVILLKCRLRVFLQSYRLSHHSTSPFQLARLFFLDGTNSDVHAGELLRNFMTLKRTL